MSEDPIDDERRIPRVRHPLTLLLEDGWTALVHNISAGGMKVETIAVLPRKLLVSGTVVFSEQQKIPLKLRVAWSTPPDPKTGATGAAGLTVEEAPDAYFRAVADLFARQG